MARTKKTTKNGAAKKAASKTSQRARGKKANGSADVGPQLFQQWKDGTKLTDIAASQGWRVGKVRATIAKAAGGREVWKAMRDARREEERPARETTVPAAKTSKRTAKKRARKQANGKGNGGGKRNGNGKQEAQS